MQIIVLHSRFSTARSITLSNRHLVLVLVVFLLCVIGSAMALEALMGRYGSGVQSSLSISQDAGKKDQYVKDNLTAMAVRLGEMQAQLMRLDALGERVQGLAGVKPEEFNFREMPGRGGAAPSSAMTTARQTEHTQPVLTMRTFQAALEAMGRDVEHRADYMNVVETALMGDKIRSKMLPTVQPVNVTYKASGFGWRFDPFTGHSAFHEGIDFPAPVGTPIVAAAGGVVIAAEYHHEFGNMLEIDHGNNIVTRYAHASRLLMHVGDIVRRGQHVADIGSTGRSTGAHLHFEVRVSGTAQDPNKFLAAGASQAALALLNSK